MIEKPTKFKEDKEKSAVEILLDKINMLEEDVKFLKSYHTILPYDMIVNAPNPITRINSHPDGLMVEYHNWRREFIPISVTKCMKLF